MLRRSIRSIGEILFSIRNKLRVKILGKVLYWHYTQILLILILGVVPLSLVGAILTSRSISSSGDIRVIILSFYSDEDCTTPLTPIDWGTLDPGSSTNKTIYVKNEGNSPLTLSLKTENWSPLRALEYLDLTWDYNGQTVKPRQSIKVILTLTVSPDISGINNFGFDITIFGTG